ncbi:MAG: exported protein of unknown function [Promethearchaeota archaeon]|nr:MAG: exported protein of unknown function [Candidatus Lokiarchaeota archaeon]
MRKSCKFILLFSFFSIGLLLLSNIQLQATHWINPPEKDIRSASIHISDPDDADFPNEYYDLKSLTVQGQNVTFEFWRSVTEIGIIDDMNQNLSLSFFYRDTIDYPSYRFEFVRNNSKICIKPVKTNSSGENYWNKTTNTWQDGFSGYDYLEDIVVVGNDNITLLVPTIVLALNSSETMRIFSVWWLVPLTTYYDDSIRSPVASSDLPVELLLASQSAGEENNDVLTYSLIGGGIAGAAIIVGVIILIVKRRS